MKKREDGSTQNDGAATKQRNSTLKGTNPTTPLLRFPILRCRFEAEFLFFFICLSSSWLPNAAKAVPRGMVLERSISKCRMAAA